MITKFAVSGLRKIDNLTFNILIHDFVKNLLFFIFFLTFENSVLSLQCINVLIH